MSIAPPPHALPASLPARPASARTHPTAPEREGTATARTSATTTGACLVHADALLVTRFGLVAEGLRGLLRNHAIAAPHLADSLEAALALAHQCRPALIVIGSECLLPEPRAAMQALVQAAAGAPVLVLARQSQLSWTPMLVDLGADAVALYEGSPEAIAQALDELLGAGSHLHPSVQHEIARSRSAPMPRRATLTRRELQVLQFVARGCSNKRIGHELGLTEGTVKTYLRRLRMRLGARDRTHAVIHALALGLVDVETA